jgi:hypothetical protein
VSKLATNIPKNSQQNFQKVLKQVHEDIFKYFMFYNDIGKSFNEAHTLFLKM